MAINWSGNVHSRSTHFPQHSLNFMYMCCSRPQLSLILLSFVSRHCWYLQHDWCMCKTLSWRNSDKNLNPNPDSNEASPEPWHYMRSSSHWGVRDGPYSEACRIKVSDLHLVPTDVLHKCLVRILVGTLLLSCQYACLPAIVCCYIPNYFGVSWCQVPLYRVISVHRGCRIL
jgi:hypothetical protein